jgi:hypothetical protein
MDIDVMWSVFNKYRPMLDEMLSQWLVNPPGNVDIPFIDGDPMVGATLSCTMGNWTHEPTGYEYQWLSDGITEVGLESTYVVADSDAGHTLTCLVTASNQYGSTEAPPSNPIAIPAAVASEETAAVASEETAAGPSFARPR